MICFNGINSTSTSIVSFLKKVVLLITIFSILQQRQSNGKVLATNDNKSTTTIDDIRTFRAGRSDIPVYVVKNFLPVDVAHRWRFVLSNEWKKLSEGRTNNTTTTKECSNANTSEESSNTCQNTDEDTNDASNGGWKYTTNNDGTYPDTKHQTNRKIRGLDDVEARNTTAHRMKRKGLFSYAKWEFEPEHDLVKEMEDVLLRDDSILSKVRRTFEGDGGGGSEEGVFDGRMKVDISRDSMSDLFVTLYSTGDFLSPHNDGFSRTYAFVVSLLETPYDDGGGGGGAIEEEEDDEKGWKDDYGEILQFLCTPDQYRRKVTRDPTDRDSFCHRLKPNFNTAILFQTRDANGNGGNGPVHEVITVAESAELEGFRRFGLTGWYQDKKDVLSKFEQEELGKVRARAK